MENEELEVQPEEGQETTQTEQEAATQGEEKTNEPDWKAEALKYKAIAERKDKQLKTNKPNNNELTREEVILIAKGIEDSDISYLKKLQAGEKAMGKEISLSEAMSDPLFVAYKEQKEAKARAEKAQLGASSSGAVHQDNQFKSNLPRDEHKKLWEEEMKKF